MMSIFQVLLVLMLAFTSGEAICINNSETVLGKEMNKTKQKIEEKQKKLNKAINKYKDALKKKKEMMQKLWTTTAHIEFLMKENQIMRKEMIKHWRDVKNTQASGQSL